MNRGYALECGHEAVWMEHISGRAIYPLHDAVAFDHGLVLSLRHFPFVDGGHYDVEGHIMDSILGAIQW